MIFSAQLFTLRMKLPVYFCCQIAKWNANVHARTRFSDIASTLSASYRCNESRETLPVALAINGNICANRLMRNLGLLYHPREISYFQKMGNTDRGREYLVGRFVAKHALSRLLNDEDYNTICIDRGAFMQPILLSGHNASLDVSITHKKDIAAAIVFPKSHPMGIDLEIMETSSPRTLESQMTANELQTIRASGYDYVQSLWQLWVIKEAISKVLKTGLTTSFLLFETCDHHFNSDGELSCHFSHFYQYRAQSWILNNNALAVVHPRTATFSIDMHSFSTSGSIPSEKLQ